ncbi:hypothetical protein ACQR1I_36345 [Bradyrhizobium sp. HKCCYLS2038]|uniref:hypothetical protein n=1 Tax=Bradyrhizobium sp. HKCCYLS2038 TaxID=3420764 RepID=UPI003EBEA780
MTTLYPVAGMKFYIGNAPLADKDTDFVASDFNSVTWVEVTGWTQAGAIGDTAALITTQIISLSRDKKQKGTSNAGSMQNVFAMNQADPGQLAMIAAAAPTNKNTYPFRIEGNDSLGVSNSKRYFVGLVMTAEESNGAANTIRNLACTVEVNSNIVRVAAA